MRWIRLLFRIFGWLLTPLLALAASFFGAAGGALLAMRIPDPIHGLIVTAACGGLAGFLTVIAWLRYLRRSPQVREVLAVTEDGTPDTTGIGMIVLFAVALGPAVAPRAEAQTLTGGVGRFYEDGGWTTYRVGFSALNAQMLDVQFHGDVFRRVDGTPGHLTGVGFDARIFGSPHDGPYALAGIGGGLGAEFDDRSYSDFWASWSLGAGYRIFPLSFLSTAVEGRWRGISLGKRNGFELGVALGLQLGGGRKLSGRPRSPQPTVPAATPVPGISGNVPASDSSGISGGPAPASRTAVLADSVIATATAAIGRRYQLGGTGADSAGFDCSGLIQYAFGAHGITLPRRSEDQARTGRAVTKKLDELRPGDLLTFSNRSGPITHVGLYLGDGKFVHSATHGVQVSVLSADDPYGRWWYKRWVGVRRIID